MADVEMTDAAPKTKVAKAVAGDSDGKKRFEIKKVGSPFGRRSWTSMTDGNVVERGRALGVGHCCRQLRHLPQPHHGPLYVACNSLHEAL